MILLTFDTCLLALELAPSSERFYASSHPPSEADSALDQHCADSAA